MRSCDIVLNGELQIKTRKIRHFHQIFFYEILDQFQRMDLWDHLAGIKNF
jgi:hypothetical protein